MSQIWEALVNPIFRNQGHELVVLGSGSSGNGYILDEYMALEAGMPFSAYKPYMNSIQMLWISHVHGDHCNIQTIKKMIEYKHERNSELLIYGNADVRNHLKKNGIYAEKITWLITQVGEDTQQYNNFNLSHSVRNDGLMINTANLGSKPLIVFATDTNKMPDPLGEAPLFLVLEANYYGGITSALKNAAQQMGGFFNDHTFNHFAAEQFDQYVINGGADENTVIIEAHQSGNNRPQNRGLQITLDQVHARINANQGNPYL